jgi:hypothetical protein
MAGTRGGHRRGVCQGRPLLARRAGERGTHSGVGRHGDRARRGNPGSGERRGNPPSRGRAFHPAARGVARRRPDPGHLRAGRGWNHPGERPGGATVQAGQRRRPQLLSLSPGQPRGAALCERSVHRARVRRAVLLGDQAAQHARWQFHRRHRRLPLSKLAGRLLSEDLARRTRTGDVARHGRRRLPRAMAAPSRRHLEDPAQQPAAAPVPQRSRRRIPGNPFRHRRQDAAGRVPATGRLHPCTPTPGSTTRTSLPAGTRPSRCWRCSRSRPRSRWRTSRGSR